LVKNNWKELKVLYLTDNGLTDNGLRTLAKGRWPKL